MVAFVATAETEAFARHVEGAYAAVMGMQANVYPVKAAPGPGVVAAE